MPKTLNVATKPKPVRIGMMSLGCPKTLVDSEVILGKLNRVKYKLVPSVADCDVALLNTCAFIQDAQQESIDRILELVELKKEKQIRGVIVMGCLVQRFPKALQAELGEVDAFIGSGEYAKIPEIVDRVSEGSRVFSVGRPGYLSTSLETRVALTPGHYRYLKISEGCDHICTFCVIPRFRGKHRSRTISDVLKEAQRLADEGAKELILTGQDTTYFGRDTEGKFLLPELLKELDKIKGPEWIRLLYAYPACVTRDLMEVIQSSSKICHYLDMPLQHASDRMLQAMKRGITKRRTLDLLREFRSVVPDLAIRTTFIVGFPGETQEDFNELLEFMKEIRFERLGIFQYSQEEGSAAGRLPDQIPEKIKEERWNQAMQLQQEISLRNNQSLLRKTFKVLIEEKSEKKGEGWIGRSYMDAPEVDGNVFVNSSKSLQIGQFYPVTITSTREYDLVGEF
ncbi:MAG: 30S ribosomal protein S12 methylthiotransferase RimO [Candidatus Omnitrophica bacterium]|nr:30S ribosomal protein S12 methylthiotransferase RimO [Candidatus Omnitrophota bacterium]